MHMPTSEIMAPSPVASRLRILTLTILSVFFLVGIFHIFEDEDGKELPHEPSTNSFPVEQVLVSPLGNSSSFLTVEKSTITGILDPTTLTSSFYWTFDFRNDGPAPREVQGKIKLPAGSVVSRATEWINGIPEEASFSNVHSATAAYESVSSQKRDPLLIASTAIDVVSFRASPVPQNGGVLRIRIGITAPMSVNYEHEAHVNAPYLISRNFGGGQATDIHIDGPHQISMIGNVAYESQYSLQKHLNTAQAIGVEGWKMSDLNISCSRGDYESSYCVRATHSRGGSYILATESSRGNQSERIYSLSRLSHRPAVKIIRDEYAAHRLSTLWAREEVYRMIYSGDPETALRMGSTFRIVTPVTAAVVLENKHDYENFGLNRDRYGVIAEQTVQPKVEQVASRADETLTQSEQLISNSPLLQGATNGTIGPAGVDAQRVVLKSDSASQDSQQRFLQIFLQVFTSLLGILSAVKFLSVQPQKMSVKSVWGLICLICVGFSVTWTLL